MPPIQMTAAFPSMVIGIHLEFQRVTRPFRVTHLVCPKTDFGPSAKECVLRGQGQIHCGIAENSVRALNVSAAPPSARPRQRKRD